MPMPMPMPMPEPACPKPFSGSPIQGRERLRALVVEQAAPIKQLRERIQELVLLSRNSDTARGQTSCSNGEGYVLICPTEWFGHGFVEVVDEIADPAGQVALGLEVAATDELENQISIWLSQEACLGVKWTPRDIQDR